MRSTEVQRSKLPIFKLRNLERGSSVISECKAVEVKKA